MHSKTALKIVVISVLSIGGAHLAFSSSGDPDPWTDWYRKGLVAGILKLKEIRDRMERENIVDLYHRLPDGPDCGENERRFRTADGTCNDLDQTLMGAAGVRMGRNVSLKAAHPDEKQILTPDPRKVSLELLTRDEFKEVPFLNMLAASWIQFMTHDWFSHGENEERDPFFLPLDKNDPFGAKDMVILRTRADLTRMKSENDLPPSYQNEVTHWWDASPIYGSDPVTQKKLRTFSNGLMKIKEDGRIPLDDDGVEFAGFKRNWWFGLSMLHHLFVKEHNEIAKHLKSSYPKMSDEELFQTARLVNSALMAKIHSVEWTSAILPNRTLDFAMNANWYGVMNQRKGVNGFLEFFKHPVLSGLVGGKKETHGKPFTMTEEFNAVYRMHPLLPESVTVKSLQTGEPLETLPLEKTRDQESHSITDRHRFEDLFYSFGTSHPGQLVLNNFPKFLQNLSVPVVGKIDLGTVDIIRDRERGIPRYNEFRRQVGLKPLFSIDQISPDMEVVNKLKSVYNNDIELVDLMIGAFAEGYRPYKFGFGETQFQIFILMASRRLQSDRFYTTDYRPEIYTNEGLKWVDRNNMRTVLARHMPALKPIMMRMSNAFNPWK